MRSYCKRIRTQAAGLLIGVLLTGCGAAVPPVEVPAALPAEAPAVTAAIVEPERYSIVLDYRYSTEWIIDRDGNDVAAEEQFYILYDVLTGEPQCQMRQRLEPLGKNENGYAITRDMAALYDMEGNLLHDWAPGYYESGWGDMIIRQNRRLGFAEEVVAPDFVTELWNYKTGEVIQPQVGMLLGMDDGKYMLLCDPFRLPLGVVETDTMAEVSGFPAPEECKSAEVWQGYIISSNRPMFAGEDSPTHHYTLMTMNFEPIFSYKYMVGSSNEPFLNCYYEDDTSEIVAADGTVIFENPKNEWTGYMDEELAVITYQDYSGENEEEYSYLVRLSDGVQLSERYTRVQAKQDYDDPNPTESFLAYNREEGMVYLLDRNGKEIASQSVPGVEWIELSGERWIRCVTETGEEYNSEVVLDQELNVVIPAGLYRNIMKVHSWRNQGLVGYNIFEAWSLTNKNGNSNTRDILDSEGNVMIAGINEIYDVGPDRLAVRKGFSVGLMDWQGNWIVKRSIFEGQLKD